MITVIYAHPYSKHSRMGKAMQNALHNLPHVQSRNLYELYPDFNIAVQAEQAQLLKSGTIVLQHPMYWYAAPAMLSLWFEKVLSRGWAYGHNDKGEVAQALAGKRVLWATTTGGDEEAYRVNDLDRPTMQALSMPIQQTVAFCGMQWLEPFSVHRADEIDDAGVLSASEAYRDRIVVELQYLEQLHAAAGGKTSQPNPAISIAGDRAEDAHAF